MAQTSVSIAEIVAALLKEEGLTTDQLILGGFSQGGALGKV